MATRPCACVGSKTRWGTACASRTGASSSGRIPDPSRTLAAFREYTRSWLRPAADPDGGTFRV